MDVVERWIPGREGSFGTRRDFLGFVDLIALCPDEGVTRLLQVTSGSGLSSRVKKITEERAEQAAVACQMPGLIVEAWGWRRLKNRGRRSWWPKRVQIVYEAGAFMVKELPDL